VSANDHVLRLVDPARLEVSARVLLADTSRVAIGRAARVFVPGGDEEGLAAVVASQPGAADPATGTAVVRLRLSTFVPVGAVVRVAMEAEATQDAVIVPAAALVRQGNAISVFVIAGNGKAERRVVTVGLESGEEAEVRSGLKASDRVVVEGQEDLPDGAAVTVADE
jgi:RND family efflux transporter MFP subunit